MSGLKELRRRQKTAMIIERMTGAMKMIARARYTSMQNEVRKNSGLTQGLEDLARSILAEMGHQKTVRPVTYTKEGPSDAPWLLVVMTSDSGLCGGFNQKLIKTALEWLAVCKQGPVEVMCVGKKGFCGLHKKPGVKMHMDTEPTSLNNVLQVTTALFKEGRIRGCFVVYGKFFNILKQEPEVLQILPTTWVELNAHDPIEMNLKEVSLESSNLGDKLEEESLENKIQKRGLLTIQPDAETVLSGVLEILVQAVLKQTMCEHKLSEHAARMNAMDSANTNAKDVIRRLQIRYNRLRQDRITKEIIEIVAGSESARGF
jgi:F-type H+-transporting ATPase subunit gamma